MKPPAGEARPAAIAAAAAIVAFAPILLIPYAVDSNALMVKRLAMHSWSAVAALADPGVYNTVTGQYSYRPITTLTHLVDINLFGLRPWVSHVVQLALHALCASLVARLAFRLGAGARTAAAAGALFGVHPIVSEVVNCAGFRGDILALAGVLAAALALVPRAGGAASLPRAAAWFAFALLSKESAAPALVILPALAWAASTKPGGGRAAASRAFLALAAAAVPCALLWVLFHAPARPYDRLGGSLVLGVANFMRIMGEVYLPAWLAPVRLRTFHEFAPSATIADGRIVLGIAACAASAAPLLWVALRSRTGAAAALWIAAGLAPYSQLVPMPDPVAERFLYFAHAGVALAAAALASAIRARFGTNATARFAVPAMMVLLLMGGLAWRRHYDWRDELSLNLANFQPLPEEPSPFAMRSVIVLGLMRGHPGDTEESARLAVLLVARDAESGESWRVAALASLKSGDAAEAVLRAERAVELAPESSLAWRTLSAALDARDGTGTPRSADALARSRAVAAKEGELQFSGSPSTPQRR